MNIRYLKIKYHVLIERRRYILNEILVSVVTFQSTIICDETPLCKANNKEQGSKEKARVLFYY